MQIIVRDCRLITIVYEMSVTLLLLVIGAVVIACSIAVVIFALIVVMIGTALQRLYSLFHVST